MAGSYSDLYENYVLNYVLNATPLPGHNTLSYGLSTSTNGDTLALTDELVATGYSRVSGINFGTAALHATTNTTTLSFTNSGGTDWPAVNAGFIVNDSSNEIIAWNDFLGTVVIPSSSLTVNPGQLVFDSGGIFTTPVDDELLNIILNGATASISFASLHMALSSTVIAEDGTGITEITDAGRKDVTSSWSTATTGSSTLTETSFTQATVAYTVKAWALYNAASAGTLVIYGNLVQSVPVSINDIFKLTTVLSLD